MKLYYFILYFVSLQEEFFVFIINNYRTDTLSFVIVFKLLLLKVNLLRRMIYLSANSSLATDNLH